LRNTGGAPERGKGAPATRGRGGAASGTRMPGSRRARRGGGGVSTAPPADRATNPSGESTVAPRWGGRRGCSRHFFIPIYRHRMQSARLREWPAGSVPQHKVRGWHCSSPLVWQSATGGGALGTPCRRRSPAKPTRRENPRQECSREREEHRPPRGATCEDVSATPGAILSSRNGRGGEGRGPAGLCAAPDSWYRVIEHTRVNVSTLWAACPPRA